jgi:NADPH:quinone reductase-like Zn-dependent oxidoreductase
MSNKAAWIKEKQGKPLVVDSAPYEKPGKEEMIVKTNAVAINPVDWKIQDYGIPLHRACCEIEAVLSLRRYIHRRLPEHPGRRHSR